MSVTITNTPDTLDSSSCILQQTTDEQINQNLAGMIQILVTAFQDGTIPVANSDRLQNLTIEDIIGIVKGEIDIPSLYNNIITNVDGTVTNVIDAITSHQITRDSRYVNTDFIQFKIEDRVNPDINKYGNTLTIPYIIAWLPQDLANKDRIVALYLTTKNDNHINVLNNDVIFEYNIFIDSNDSLGRYKIEIPASKIEIGQTILFDATNLPSQPNKWGLYSAEKYIKATYLVDEYWVPSEDNTITAEGQFSVAKKISSGPIPMNFGNTIITEPNESINIIKESTNIINPTNNDILVLSESVNTINNPRWIVLPEYTNVDFSEIGDKLGEFISDNTKIILQEDSDVITNIIDNLNDFATIHTLLGTTANELSNVFIMPPNKVILQLVENLNIINSLNTGSFTTKNTRIVEQLVSNLIEKKVSTIPDGTFLGATSQGSLILRMETMQNNYTAIRKFYVPDHIIEEIVNEIVNLDIQMQFIKSGPAVILLQDLLTVAIQMASFIKDPTKVISLMKTIRASYREMSFFFMNFDRIIEQDKNLGSIPFKHNLKDLIYSDIIKNKSLQENFIKNSNLIIEQIDQIIIQMKKHYNSYKKGTLISEQSLAPDIKNRYINLNDPTKLFFDNYNASHQKTTFPAYQNVSVREAVHIINPLAYFPVIMNVTSSTVNYLQDVRNMKLISSLSQKEEYIPLYTSEGQQQRSTYEMIAEQDQRVFDIKSNPYDTTVYREGFRLSRGDYYTNGSKIILKSGANSGEIITIISERKYSYSNNVSKEELENVINNMKADRPIISYPAITYELATVQIKIENFSSSNVYDIDVKFDGRYRDDIAFVRNKDTIYLDIPEVVNARRKVLQLTIRCQEVGKLQSVPTTAEINIRNLYDYASGSDIKRLVIGATPIEWYGKQMSSLVLADTLTNLSTYQILPADSNNLERIKIDTDNYIQSNVIAVPDFNGTFIDPYIGLENIDSRRINILSGTTTETIIDLGSPIKFDQPYIEEAFKTGKLWFIIDASTDNAINQEFLNATNGAQIGSNQKYAYRRANELMSNINLIPRTTNSLYMEHIDKLKNRVVKDIIIFDIELRLDYDFEDFAIISENGQVTKKDIQMESIEYFVQEDVPHLLIKINSPEIPNPNNPYLNISSNVFLPMNITSLNTKQNLLPEKGFAVNNIYNERIFSGIQVDHSAPNQDKVIPFLKDIKKFNLGINYINSFKNDYFVLTEEDTATIDPTGNTTKKEIYLGMVRFKTDEEIIKENIFPQTRLKLFNKFLTREKSIKSLVNTNNEILSAGSTYTSDFAIVEYGGLTTYLDNENLEHTTIDSVIGYRRVFIQDNFDIQNGVNPTQNFIYDGHHVIYGEYKETRIPNYWDVVFRPSLRTQKEAELKFVWSLARDNIDITDQRWSNITDGLLIKGSYLKDTTEFVGREKIRDVEVINLEDKKGFLIFGGIGYKPTKVRKIANRITGGYLNALAKADDPIFPSLQWVYNTAGLPRYEMRTRINELGVSETYSYDTNRWFNRIDLIDIRYGWENNEPYVDYHWCKTYRVTDTYNGDYDVAEYYVDRISRTKVINKDIYYVDTGFIDNGYINNDSTFSQTSSLVRKFANIDYQKLYTDDTGSTPIIITNPNHDNRTVFQDIIYESGSWWLTAKEINTNGTSLYQLTFDNEPSLASSLQFKKVYTLDINPSKWSLTKDVTSTLRGEGPILINHLSNDNYINNINTIGAGIYYWDTWNSTLFKKVETNLPASATIFGVPEIIGVRNPYFLVVDYLTDINIRIDIVGTRLFLIIYLDKFISLLTSEEFNLFKEEILHTEKLISAANPNKILQVLPNDMTVPIRAILPNDDNYKASSAQITFNRTETQTGRKATNLVFRVTNTIDIPLELDSIRFTTK